MSGTPNEITKIVLLLFAMIGLEFIGILVGRYLGLSQSGAVGVGLLPALLVAFPLVKRRSGDGLNFGVWMIIAFGVVSTGALINYLIR